MAIALSSKTNVINSDPDFPNGKIKDAPNGTPVNAAVHQDFHQFFARILERAGITPNGLFDNATNGYQLVSALGFYQDGGALASTSVTVNSTGYNRFAVQGNRLHWQAKCSISVGPGTDTIFFTVPSAITTLLGLAAFAQNDGQFHVCNYLDSSGDYHKTLYLDINSNGRIAIVDDYVNATNFNPDDAQIFFDLTIPIKP